MYITQTDVETLLGAFTIPDAWLGVGSDDPDETPLNQAILRACQQIDALTRNHFELATRVLELRGDGSRIMSLLGITTWPINSISEIIYRADPAYDWETQGDILTAADYSVSRSRHAIERVGSETSAVSARMSENDWNFEWVKGYYNNYRATLVLGYTTTPYAIKKAAVMLVQEDIIPGTAAKSEQLASESFPDGYSSQRVERTVASQTGVATSLTGYASVDRLLRPYMCRLPGLLHLG